MNAVEIVRNPVLPMNSPLGMNLSGRYFRAANPTIGTGITMGIQTSYSATANVLLLMYNPAASKRYIVLDFLKLICTAAGASTTSSQIVFRLDNKDRFSANGTSLLTGIVQPGVASGASALNGTGGRLLFAAITANAEGSAITAGRASLKIAAAPCWAINDTVVLTFGTVQAQYGTLAATTAAILPIYMGPIIVPPGYSLTGHMWNVANATTAPSWEMEIGWMELDATGAVQP